MRKKRQKFDLTKTWVELRQPFFFLSSFVIHSFFILLLSWDFKSQGAKTEVVQLDILFQEKVESKVRKPLPEPEETQQPVAQRIEATQIVEQKVTQENQKAVNTKFLSEKNQVVAKEKKAKISGTFQIAKKGKVAQRFVPALADSLDNDFIVPKDLSVKEEQAVTGQSLDYIKELDPDTETLLNSKEFIYFAYYARIRKKLDQFWSPIVKQHVAKLEKQKRNIAFSQDRITKLLLTIDTKGQLLKVQVIGTSGVTEFDAAAAEAFRRAAPFTVPPEGMIDPDGQIKIRWDLIIES